MKTSSRYFSLGENYSKVSKDWMFLCLCFLSVLFSVVTLEGTSAEHRSGESLVLRILTRSARVTFLETLALKNCDLRPII